jgi:KipI family sensor histidine kinase inhibitor
MERRRYGPHGWLLDEVPDPAGWARAALALRDAGGLDGVTDVVPGESTVVVRCVAGATDSIGRRLDSVVAEPAGSETAPVTIEVVFDGADLDRVAGATGLSTDAVVGRFVAASYRVAFCGFSPGFAYLAGLDPDLHLERRPSPRPRVPAGSVAIAAHYAAVYPSASPGGWHLIGRTDAVVWDLAAPAPALLTPGTEVRFVDRESR